MTQKFKQYWKWFTGALATIFLIVDHLSQWGVLAKLWQWIVEFIGLVSSNRIESLVIALLLVSLLLWRKTVNLSRYVAITFKDNFRQNLRKNWDLEGRWEPIGNGELRVTQSDIGGITKVGQLWTDYRFEFDGLIVNDRIGWIVRAQDLFNYYMFQLTQDLVRPHLRIGGQWILLPEAAHNHTVRNNEWLHISTEVRGPEVRIYIGEREIYSNGDMFSMKFFQIALQQGTNVPTLVQSPQPNTIIVPAFTTGRVGFRMHGAEEGRIRKCRVKPI